MARAIALPLSHYGRRALQALEAALPEIKRGEAPLPKGGYNDVIIRDDNPDRIALLPALVAAGHPLAADLTAQALGCGGIDPATPIAARLLKDPALVPLLEQFEYVVPDEETRVIAHRALEALSKK